MKPRGIIWDLFGDHLRYLDGGRIQMRALTELLDGFGVGESTSRVRWPACAVRAGSLPTVMAGRPATAYGPQHQDAGRGPGRIFDRGQDDWDGAWRMVIYAVPEENRSERDRVRRALAWHGFGPLAAATWISPHPRLGYRAQCAGGPVRHPDGPAGEQGAEPPADRDMAARCWDLEGLGRDYAELVTGYERLPSAAGLARLPGPQALRRQVELVSSYRTLPFRDPDLPAALLPEGWPGRPAHALFQAAHDALHGPADVYVRDVVARSKVPVPAPRGPRPPAASTVMGSAVLD